MRSAIIGAIEALCRRLERGDQNEFFLVEVLNALAQIAERGNTRAKKAVSELLEDNDEDVRVSAVNA